MMHMTNSQALRYEEMKILGFEFYGEESDDKVVAMVKRQYFYDSNIVIEKIFIDEDGQIKGGE